MERPKPLIDPQRSNVKAMLIDISGAFYVDNRLHGPYGAFIDRTEMDGSHWILCCPGCGEAGSPRDGAKWTIMTGSFDDVTTLTLRPSIQKHCCGWHGYLTKGVFDIQCKDY
jgi:hypothetical protein